MRRIKKMKKAVIAIALLFIAASCAQSGFRETDVHVGTDGLLMNFEVMAPPGEAFEGEAVPITIKMVNRGAYDIKGAFYSIAVEKAYLSLEGESMDSFSINGRTAYDTAGGELLVRKGAFVGNLDPMTETISTAISVTACYTYQTSAGVNVCIDTDIFNQNPQKVCTASDVSFSEGGQGAPVSLVRIEPQMRQHPTDKSKIVPQFLIYISNAGNGQCVEPSMINNVCKGGSVSPENWNTAVVKAFLLDRQLDCTPKIKPDSTALEGHIKFSRDEAQEDFIRCELKEGIDRAVGTYTSALNLQIDYGYTTSISKSVRIKKV